MEVNNAISVGKLSGISAHFDTKLSPVSKILVNIMDNLQRACSLKTRTPLSIVLARECPLTNANILW